VKIDVEGMEVDVLKGANQVLTSDRPHVFAEASSRTHFHALRSYLRQFGYVPLSRWAVTPVYHFAYEPTPKLKWRSRTHKFQSEMTRFTEARRLARTLLDRFL
jgi:hypothetical protein